MGLVPVNNSFTNLLFDAMPIAPYSVRGLQQTLTPIAQASQLRRTVNGNLIDLGFEGFKKYASTITGSDQLPPAFDGIWPGKTVVVDCIAMLSYPSGGMPLRPVVPGSEYTEGGVVYYRPRLTVLIVNWTINEDEYGRVSGWTLNLEEV
jgi:hypothetical protein